MSALPRPSLLAALALCAGTAKGGAQIHHVDAPEHVTRAVGVYEWTGDLSKPTAARFVPVSLFIDGRFEDAGLYLARPVPFALQSGDLYTVERSGEPEGVLDLEQAERVVSGNALADNNPAGVWYGFGKFTTAPTPKAGPALHRSAHLGVIQATPDPSKPHTGTSPVPPASPSDERPQMTRRTPAADGSSGSTNAGQESSGTGADHSDHSDHSSGKSSGKDSTDDTDRPTLARRDPSQDAARQRAVDGGKKATASVRAVGPAPGDDPDRPTLSHGSAAAEVTKELTGMPADLHQAVAVSDPVVRDPHPFARPWEDPAERAATLAALAALAKPRVAAYLAENRLVPSTAQIPAGKPSESTEGVAANTENGAGAAPKLQRGKPREYGSERQAPMPDRPKPLQHAAGPARSRPAAAAPLTLQSQEIAGFTLSYGGLPTFVYTASVPAAAMQAKDLPPAATHPTAFVTLVAQRLPSGELQVALGAVTDSLHLERSPRLHLVDAVDPDASHRASLLFELRSGSSRQFALYRFTSAKAENTFTSASVE